MGILEARCTVCGETFNPADENDLLHLEKNDGTPCLRRGVLVGEYNPSPRPTTQRAEPQHWTVNDLFLQLDDLLKGPGGADIGRLPVRFIGPMMRGPMLLNRVTVQSDHLRIT